MGIPDGWLQRKIFAVTESVLKKEQGISLYSISPESRSLWGFLSG